MNRIITILFIVLLMSTNSHAIIKTVRPSADTSAQWVAKSGGDNYVEVDDKGMDNNSSMIYSTTLNDLDTWTFDDLNLPPDIVISSVVLQCRCRRSDLGCSVPPGGCPSATLQVTHDATYEDSEKTCGHSTRAHNTTLEFDITGEETWEPGDFDGQAISFGTKLTQDDGASLLYITRCYLVIDYTNAYDDTILSQAVISQATIGDD